MNKFDPKAFSTPELLRCFADILDELKQRGVVRTRNNPVADYAEWLTKQKLDLDLAPNSKAGYDATGKATGTRFQIKSRRLDPLRSSRRLSVIRDLDDILFDHLIGILFNTDSTVEEAYKVPHGVIAKYARFSEHQHGHILHLCGDILRDPSIEDITHILGNDHSADAQCRLDGPLRLPIPCSCPLSRKGPRQATSQGIPNDPTPSPGHQHYPSPSLRPTLPY